VSEYLHSTLLYPTQREAAIARDHNETVVVTGLNGSRQRGVRVWRWVTGDGRVIVSLVVIADCRGSRVSQARLVDGLPMDDTDEGIGFGW